MATSTDTACDQCGRQGELYHNEASGLAYCIDCDQAAEKVTTSFKRLHKGGWGVTGPSALLQEGAEIEVTKKDGSTTTVTVGRVMWSDESKAIARIKRDTTAPAA